MSGGERPCGLVLVEWRGARWLDMKARVEAGQLKMFSEIVRRGRIHGVSFDARETTSLEQDILAMGLSPVRIGYGSESSDWPILPEDLDPELARFFPGSEACLEALMSSLAGVYSAQNAAVDLVSEEGKPDALLMRLTLLEDVARIYRTNEYLGGALGAAWRLLDLLLVDLHRQMKRGRWLVVWSAGGSRGDGFAAVLPPAGASINQIPIFTREQTPLVLRGLMTGGVPEPVFLPQLHSGLAVRPRATLASDRLEFRLPTQAEERAVARTFPRVPWVKDSDVRVAIDGAGLIHAAISVDRAGGVCVATQAGYSGHPEAGMLFQFLSEPPLADRKLFNVTNVPAEDPLVTHWLAAGCRIKGRLTLWQASVNDAERRMEAFRTLGQFTERWIFRPACDQDLNWWRERPDMYGLVPSDGEFDADLSWTAETLDGCLVGTLLLRRVGSQVLLPFLGLVAERRKSLVAGQLVGRSMRSMKAAGFHEAIFTTFEDRVDAISLARHMAAKALSVCVRLGR